MKNITIVLFSVVTMSSAFASLPNEVASLVGKPGVFTSLYNGKSIEGETGSGCKIEEGQYGDSVVVIDSVSYFTPTADLEDAERSEKNGVVTFETTATGKRPGGSVCGDYSPLTSYKQTVIVTKKSVTLKQKFSCAIFDRSEIVETCTVK